MFKKYKKLNHILEINIRYEINEIKEGKDEKKNILKKIWGIMLWYIKEEVLVIKNEIFIIFVFWNKFNNNKNIIASILV